MIKIVTSCPNVRSEPVADRFAKDETNSFGTTKEKGFTIEVSRLYTTDKHLDNNGSYFGSKSKISWRRRKEKNGSQRGSKKTQTGLSGLMQDISKLSAD
ncbi:hypothetical protein IKF92_00445 [Candidatus Saccharibacteria bacterium]|nr:hypothetical protein [Candidatus Saccharibacteria bacterium]